MRKLAAHAGIIGLALGAHATANAYTAQANVTFDWATGGTHIGWTANGNNSITVPVDNTSYFTTSGGSNSTTFYNSDFADAGSIAANCLPAPAIVRQYGCIENSGFTFVAIPALPPTGIGPGASASGTLNVTDTTLTGTLTVTQTTDLCIGAKATGQTPGCGKNGFNVRSADGSPFGNVWYGFSQTGTLVVNLTGTFSATNWEITGGTARITDAAFDCQNGGGGAPVLCTVSTVIGGYDSTGSAQSFGVDLDGGGAGTAMGPVVVKDNAGTSTLTSLSGVLASLALDGGGNITTTTGEWRAALGSSSGGCPDHIRYDQLAVDANKDIICGTLTVGDLDVTGTAVEIDGDPDAFSFTDQTDVQPDAVITSNTLTITGISGDIAISVTGGEYSINSGAFTSTAGIINNNDTVAVRHTSSSSSASNVNTTLTIGSLSDSFTSTTITFDTSPDAFIFTDQTDVPQSSVRTSNTVTITGITGNVPISVTGGEYQVNSGAFTSAAGTITNNATVTVRHTSAAAPSANTNTTLTVGSGSDTFTSTTLATDTVPDAFAFTDVTDVAPSTVQTSNTIAISGINAAAAISVTGGEYSVNGGAFTAVAGTVVDGDDVAVRHTSSAASATAVNTTLTVGGVSDTFTSTTFAFDSTPNAFAFTDQTNVPFSSVRTSNAVTIAGINVPAAISVTGGEYSVNSGAFTSAAGNVVSGDSVVVRHTSSGSPTTAVNTVLTVGGVSDTFTSTTQAVPPDTTPDAFSFPSRTNVKQLTLTQSNTVTITGINQAAPVSVSNGEYSVGCTGTFTSAAGTINNNQTICVRHTSASSGSVTTTLNIGGVVATFTSTTGLPGGGGGNSADALTLGLLGLLAIGRARRRWRR